MAKQNKVTIRGKTYDLDDAADIVSIQNALVPPNWPLKRPDAVRLFVSLQNMAALQFKRHFAANFKGLLKAALEEGEDSGSAKIAANFGFEIDVTAPQVAALTKLGLKYSVKHGTTGKPQTHDLTQGEFLDDDGSVVVSDADLDKEKKDAEEAEEKAKIEQAKLDAEAAAAGAGGDITAENQPGDAPAVDKPKRKRKK